MKEDYLVEFLNQEWHALFEADGGWATNQNYRIGYREHGTGWWEPTDEAHPDYQRRPIMLERLTEPRTHITSSSGDTEIEYHDAARTVLQALIEIPGEPA